jgi:DNA-binding GntR family transcriptional regulator
MAARQDGTSLEQRIYDLIHRAVFEHRLLPGTHLPEETLAAIFGVNRQRIRRVLLRLAHEKIVELRPNRGACVAQPSPREATDIFTVRTVLETFAVRELAGRLLETHVAQLERHLADEQAAFEHGDRHAVIRLSGEFHVLLAGLTGNSVLEELVRGLVARSSLLLALYGGNHEDLCSHEEHRRLLDALIRGNRERAEELMSEHLSGIAGRLRLEEPVSNGMTLHAVFRDLVRSPDGTTDGAR